jgi:hypothetical protein
MQSPHTVGGIVQSQRRRRSYHEGSQDETE